MSEAKESEDNSDSQTTAIGVAVKRAMENLNSSISAKPTKLARYSNSANDNSYQPLEDFYREMQCSPLELNMSAHSFRSVIPPDKLKLDERHTPLDVEAFLSRVETYDLLLWSNKPEQLNSYQCARYGWRIAGSNTLVCVSCHRVEIIPRDVPSCMTLKDWASKIENRIKKSGHMSGCIWVSSPSPENIIQLPCGTEMQSYLIRAAESFKRMKTLPLLKYQYRLIMGNVELKGLKVKTNMNLNQEIVGTSQGMMENTALFLMMNGWTIDDDLDDVLKCHRCLREVPLWQSLSTPTSVVIDEIMSPLSSPYSKSMSNIKELDPVNNHCVWCPWRINLQTVSKIDKMIEFLDQDDTNLYSNDGKTTDINKQPEVEDYMELACKIDSDFKSGRLLHGNILEISDSNAAVKTLMNVKELLSVVTGSKNNNNHARASFSKNISSRSEGLENEIMTIQYTTNIRVVRKLFENDSGAVENEKEDDVLTEDEGGFDFESIV